MPTVLRVVDGAPGRMLTTLRIGDWIKPASEPATTTIDTVDVASGGADV